MTSKKQPAPSPYPSIFEVYRTLATAFDIKRGGDNRKGPNDLDRAAREGGFDCTLPYRIIVELMGDQLERTTCGCPRDAKAIALFFQYDAATLASWYLQAPRHAPSDALSREQVLPILVEEMFLPFAAQSLARFNRIWGGPVLARLVSPAQNPVVVALEWAEQELALEHPIEKALWPSNDFEHKRMKDLVGGWRRGRPPKQATINDLCRALADSPLGQAQPGLAPRVRLWMLIARALLECERWAARYLPSTWGGAKSLRTFLAATVGEKPWFKDDRTFVERTLTRINTANMLHGQRFGRLPEYGNHLIAQLNPTVPKAADDERRLGRAIQEYERLAAKLDPEGHGNYGVALMKARHHVCAGRLADALAPYERAVDLALYRAGGKRLTMLAEEAVTLAAHLRKRPAAKRLINKLAGAALIWPAGATLQDGTIAAATLDAWAAEFADRFPPSGRFGGVDEIPPSHAG